MHGKKRAPLREGARPASAVSWAVSAIPGIMASHMRKTSSKNHSGRCNSYYSTRHNYIILVKMQPSALSLITEKVIDKRTEWVSNSEVVLKPF